MEINGEFKMKSTDLLLKERGLEDMGRVQEFIDNSVIQLMDEYTPMRSGLLKILPKYESQIGSGLIVQSTPYARYQYYGKVMVGPAPKQVTDIPLTYNGAPMRGAFWFERMKADHAADILRGAQNVANKGVK